MIRLQGCKSHYASMTSRDKNLYNIARSQDEFPYVITYKEGGYRVHSTDSSNTVWHFELSNGRVIESGIKKSKELDTYVARMTIEDAAFLIHDYAFDFIPDGIKSSGSAIVAIVESIGNGTYVPRKQRVKSKVVDTYAMNIKVKKTYQVQILGYEILVIENDGASQLRINWPNNNGGDSIEIPNELMIPLAQLLTEII